MALSEHSFDERWLERREIVKNGFERRNIGEIVVDGFEPLLPLAP